MLKMADAPRVGEVSNLPCPVCSAPRPTRILSVPTIADSALAASIKGYPYASHRFHEKQLQGIRRTDPKGHPIIESRRHEREVIARSRDTATPLARE
jgi:hypothetical protein